MAFFVCVEAISFCIRLPCPVRRILDKIRLSCPVIRIYKLDIYIENDIHIKYRI